MIKIVLLLLALSTNVFAEWVWEEPKLDMIPSYGQSADVPEDEPQLKYNAMDDKWSYENKEDILHYNPMESKWEFAPPDALNYYNAMEDKWEMK